MANPELVNQLKNGVIEWNRWRAENRAISLDLRGVDLSGEDLNGVDLSSVNLDVADLRGTNFRDANLRYASLSAANLNGADLSDANLRDTDVSGADLSHASLQNVNLRDSNLHSANLSGASLCSADLSGADLSHANIICANLSGTDLSVTNIRHTDFYRADLSSANLRGANLSGANLSEATLTKTALFETVFSNVGLKGARNLDSCIHAGPSTIDHRTLERSGMLPTIFLRGCGLPDSLIEYYPSLLNQPISYYSCFISYSHSDKAFARRLHDQLQGRGVRCWLDEHQILPGDKIIERVDQGIRYWDKVLLCASKQSLSSWWVEAEIEKAFKKEETLMRRRGREVLSLIPLNLDGRLFSWENAWADKVKHRHAPDFSGWETNNEIFEQSLERVVLALQADETGRESPPTSKL